MVAQPRAGGMFQSQYQERRGEAIALRLSASLDAQVRQAAGWQSKADNTALRDWVEAACKERVARAASPAPPNESGYTPEQIRTVINRIAMQTPPKQRGAVLKQFNALMGELLAAHN